MMKKNSVVLHKNCSCCGGLLQSLSLKELTDLALDVDSVGDEVVQFTLDETQVYGVIFQIDDDEHKYADNYLCKLLENYKTPFMHGIPYGDMLVFKEKEMANDYHEMCKELIKTEE